MKVEGGIQTQSGLIVSPLWPSKNSITPEDIAHGLGFMCRFGGQCKYFYSVGQHCIIGAQWFKKRGMLKEAKWFLLHEGAEGLGMMDMPHPVKYLPQMEPYKFLESSFQNSIYKRFGLIGKVPKAVKELDIRMCAAEAKVLMNPMPEYALEVDTSDIIIKPYKDINLTRKVWMKEFHSLFS